MMTVGREMEMRLSIDFIFGQPEQKNQEQTYGSQYANQLRNNFEEV